MFSFPCSITSKMISNILNWHKLYVLTKVIIGTKLKDICSLIYEILTAILYYFLINLKLFFFTLLVLTIFSLHLKLK